jgi:hypothetical protein
MSPISIMKPDVFNTNFNHQNYIDYLALVFEDDDFDADSLKEPIEVGIARGLKKYEEENRKVNLFVYLTYFAKNEVLKYKSLKKS